MYYQGDRDRRMQDTQYALMRWQSAKRKLDEMCIAGCSEAERHAQERLLSELGRTLNELYRRFVQDPDEPVYWQIY